MINKRDAADVKRGLKPIHLDGSYGEIYAKNGMIHIDNVSGDWKHTHKYLDYVLEVMGFELFEEIHKEERLDDWYTSDHIYVKEI